MLVYHEILRCLKSFGKKYYLSEFFLKLDFTDEKDIQFIYQVENLYKI